MVLKQDILKQHNIFLQSWKTKAWRPDTVHIFSLSNLYCKDRMKQTRLGYPPFIYQMIWVDFMRKYVVYFIWLLIYKNANLFFLDTQQRQI